MKPLRTNLQIAIVAGLLGLILIAVLVIELATSHGSAVQSNTIASDQASAPSDGTSAQPLFSKTIGHGDVASTAGTETAAVAPQAPSAAAPGKGPAKPDTTDPYAEYERKLIEQQLADKLQLAAREDKARETAYDAPLVPGNYTPSLTQLDTNRAGSAGTVAQLGPARAAIGGAGGASLPTASASSAATQASYATPGANGAPDVGYLKYGAIPARSPYEIKKGSVIPAVLVTGINSDLPGNVTAQVSENVYDTRTGNAILIPKGSRLFGTYNDKLTYNQSRVLVTWSHLILPNGSTVLLEDQMGTDAQGQSGFHDQRKGNFLRILAGNLLFSIVGAGQQALEYRIQQDISKSATDSGAISSLVNGVQGLDAGSAAASAAGLYNAQNANDKPTLIIRPGYQFNVLVAKDMVLQPWGEG